MQEIEEGERISQEDILAVDEALESLADVDPEGVQLVKLRHFAGLSIEHAADVLGISVRSAYRNWSFCRAQLYQRLHGGNRRP